MKWKKHNISLRVIFTEKNGDSMEPRYLGQTHSLQLELSEECENIFSLGCPTPLLLQGKACGRPGFLQSPCLPLNNLVIESSPVSLEIMQAVLIFPCIVPL